MKHSKASILSVALIAGLATVNAAEPLEKDFKYKDALKYYHTETSALLKQSLLSAGFAIDETNEVDDIYLDFASRALNAEKERIERIRDALASQTCSEGDGQCTPPPAKKKIDKSKYSPGFGHFLTHDLEPGQAELMRWEHDGSIVQDYAVRVGLPPDLVPTIKAYVKDMGLLDIMTNMLYDDPLSPGDAKWFTFQSPYQKANLAEGSTTDELRNFTWNVERPDKKWKSDMHWFNTADELSHEEGLRVLAKGGFDQVLAGIGEKMGLDSLNIDSFGFVAVTNCDRGFIHTDWEDVDGRAFNFLVGIESPDQAGPELIVEGDFKGEIYYGSNAGILVGDGTRHGTRECDHRAYRGVRIACSIYLSDVTKDNLETLAGDTTSIFPPTGKTAADWVWTQGGRHWSKKGGRSLVDDVGRKPFNVEDEMEGCKKHLCIRDDDEGRYRNSCMKTCNVFMNDEDYKPGTERREVYGY
ncbi:hypothetical protein QTG54_004742 [Skeletonema marinoi]|uniref:Fe2OG dioxygenase domain-containing protein n=1 Tax=Skeletonema marinoi TaxID=267567 RepID=A0AAD9DFF9_9STRA|nr:hypothetical protein QTG54_004742 [Skeletonema marinoi]